MLIRVVMRTLQLMLLWALRCALILFIACVVSRTIRTAILSNIISLLISARAMCLPGARRGAKKPNVSKNADGTSSFLLAK